MKKSLLLLFLFFFIKGFGQTYNENFDTDSAWSGGNGYTNLTYELSTPSHNDKFTSNNSLKETSYVNSTDYAWRLKNSSNVYLRYECEGTVSSFSIYAARWDNNPKPQVTVRYSIDSGSNYTTAFTLSGDDFSGDKIYKKFSYTFPTPITNNTGNKIYIEFVTNSGERMMYDDFSIDFTVTGGGPIIENITHTPSPVTPSDDVNVSAEITDADGINSVELHWGLTSGNLNNTIQMSNTSSNTYTTDTSIPSQTLGTTVYYEIYAIDNNANDNTSQEQNYTVSNACASELIISEYVEGSSNNKYLEIYNGTGSDININNYEIRIYANGSSSPSSTITLNSSQPITDSNVFVIANSSANIWNGTPDQTSGSLNYNGDDAIELYNTNTGQSVDIIGQIGHDPGSEWGTGDTSTANNTIRRKANIISGDTDGNDTFDPATEWDGYPENNVDDLGQHTMNCNLTCTEPTNDATFQTNSPENITTNSVTLNWNNGNGEKRIVIMREENPITFIPSDNETYTANSQFGNGTDVSGNGEYVVYNGDNSTVDISNLTPGTEYYTTIYEYSCSAGNEDYYTNGTPATDVFLTQPDKTASFNNVCIAETNIELNWGAPLTGNFEGYLLVVREGSTPHSVNSLDPNSNLGEDTDYTQAATFGSTSPESRILYKGTNTSINITGLTPNTDYTFAIYTYATGTSGYIYSTAKTITRNTHLNEVNSAKASEGNTEAIIDWENPDLNCFDEILVVANETSGIDFTPSGDGSAYTANSTYTGNNSIIYKGDGTNVTVTGLTNGTTYYFEIFVRKGTDWSSGIEVYATPSVFTPLYAGDLAILAVNTDIDNKPSATDKGSGDQIVFVIFKDIEPGTKLYFTDNGYERKVAEKWGNSEGVIAITRINNTLPAGTIVVLEANDQTYGNILAADQFDIYTCGHIDNDWDKEYVAGNGGFNLNKDDDIWIMQGGTWDNGDNNQQNATYTGNILYGWTESGWDDGVGNGNNGSKWSNLYPGNKCFTTVAPVGDGKVKFDDPNDPDFSSTNNDQLDWIALINTTGNWNTYSTNSDYNNNGFDYKGDNNCPQLTIASETHTAGKWTANGNNNNWFDCANWDNLKVPDKNTDVFIDKNANFEAVIDPSLPDANLYNGIAQTHNLEIDENIWVEASKNNSKLQIYGNLLINNNAKLIMNDNDATTSPDGELSIYGNWTNNYGDNGFNQGNSKVTFIANTPQTVFAYNTTEKFYDLTLNNPTGVIFSSGNIHAENDLNILSSSSINIQNGHYLLAGHNLKNNTAIVVENQGSLVQTDDNGSIEGSGTFKLNKESLPLNHYYDCVFWSSPIQHGNLKLEDIRNDAWRYYKFDPTIVNNPGQLYPGWVMLSSSDIVNIGIGYVITPPFNFSGGTLSTSFIKGNDPFNNGPITVNIYKKGGPEDIGDNNLLGNPYPSAIDFNKFAADNPDIDGSYALWTNCAGLDVNNHHQEAGYSIYSVSGTNISACNGNGASAERYIASTQGFMVIANADNSTVTFKNTHRVLNQNNNFLNKPIQNERDIVWLDIKDNEGKFNQIAIGFYPNATDSYDRLYDAKDINKGNGFNLSSLLNGEKLSIQGLKKTTDINRIIPLSIENDENRDIIFHINHFVGFKNINIYLRDNYLNITHDIKNSDYFTNIDAGIFNKRFELIFTKSLKINKQNTNPNAVLITQNQNYFYLHATNNQLITNIQVYDISGRLIYKEDNLKQTDIKINLHNVAIGNLLLFRTELNAQSVIIKKVIKK